MAKASTNTKKETSPAYKEFKYTGENGNIFEGRIWVENSKQTDKALITPISLTINGLVIIGCKLVETEKGNFITFPQFQAKDGTYKNMVFFTNKDDIEDLKGLVKEIEEK